MATETLAARSRDDKNLGIAVVDKKRIAVIDEVTKGFCFDGGKVKAITGDTTGIEGRKNYEDYATFKPTYKLLIATNDLPAFDTEGRGILNRATVIPFYKSFPLVSQFDKMWNGEIPGILNWLITGCRKFQSSGLDDMPTAIRQATHSYRATLDPFSEWLSTCTKKVSGAQPKYSADNIKERYNNWLLDSGLGTEQVSKGMSSLLKEQGYKVEKTNINHLGNTYGVWELRFIDDVD